MVTSLVNKAKELASQEQVHNYSGLRRAINLEQNHWDICLFTNGWIYAFSIYKLSLIILVLY